jgi:DNA-directed RNA polymerase specialized sigma24 family protein
MNDANLQQRLSQISTAWTLIAHAQGGPADADTAAQAALVGRYQAAVYRYLLGALRDPDAADELFQEFALRLVRGDFRRADASRGRFRDFVKTALINLVINYQKKQARQRPLGPAAPEPATGPQERFDSDEKFLADWRKALLDRAWETLAAGQSPNGPPFYAVLRYRSEHPELSGAELTEQLTALLKPATPFTDAGLRKILQRARDQFTDLLVDEVARSLGTPSLEELEQELIDLGFHTYCRRALQRRRASPS